jgi:formylglycine-generating enzyme required for sulfatase activity
VANARVLVALSLIVAGCGSSEPRVVAPVASASPAPAVASAASSGCPEGTARFDGGAYDESKRGRHVTVGALCVGTHEVTVAEYARCVKDARCAPAFDTAAWPLADEGSLESASEACNARHQERGEHPVNCVDWSQAVAYCAYREMRLPSDEEWEWLARGGARGATYPWGDEPPSAERVCAGRGSTCAVAPSDDAVVAGAQASQAISGLIGNVWEWTSSFADARQQQRSFRGGGFSTPLDGLASWPRSAFPESARTEMIGVRCVSDARGEQAKPLRSP